MQRARPAPRGARSLGRVALLGALLLAPGAARAADPMVTVLRNTLLGGVTGLVLGGALSLVTSEEHQGDTVRWGFVIGTFGGFGLGVALAARGEDALFSGTRIPAPAAPPLRARLAPRDAPRGGGLGLRPAPPVGALRPAFSPLGR
jgi:hypothetical protein